MIRASLQFPGAYPTVTVFQGRIFIASGVATGPWTLTELEHVGDTLRIVSLVRFGLATAGPAQEIRPGVLTWHEMVPEPRWPRWELDLATMQTTQVGDTMPSGQIVCRDGYVLSVLPSGSSDGRAELDDRVLFGNQSTGRGDTCNGHVMMRDHSNNQLQRLVAGGQWDYKNTPMPITDAVIQPSGDVIYTFGADVRIWFTDGLDRPLPLALWAVKSASWAWGADWAAFAGQHPGSGRQFVFLTPDTTGPTLVLERGTQDSWVRVAPFEGSLAVVATWHAYLQPATVTIDLVDLAEPLTVPEAPVALPPAEPVIPDPPAPPDFSVVEPIPSYGRQVLHGTYFAFGGSRNTTQYGDWPQVALDATHVHDVASAQAVNAAGAVGFAEAHLAPLVDRLAAVLISTAGDEPMDALEARVAADREMASARGVGLWLYMDRRGWSGRAPANLTDPKDRCLIQAYRDVGESVEDFRAAIAVDCQAVPRAMLVALFFDRHRLTVEEVEATMPVFPALIRSRANVDGLLAFSYGRISWDATAGRWRGGIRSMPQVMRWLLGSQAAGRHEAPAPPVVPPVTSTPPTPGGRKPNVAKALRDFFRALGKINFRKLFR